MDGNLSTGRGFHGAQGGAGAAAAAALGGAVVVVVGRHAGVAAPRAGAGRRL